MYNILKKNLDRQKAKTEQKNYLNYSKKTSNLFF